MYYTESLENRVALLEREIVAIRNQCATLYTKYSLAHKRELMYQQMLSNYIVESYYRFAPHDFDIADVMQDASSVMVNKDFKHLGDNESMLGEFLKRSFNVDVLQFRHKTWKLEFDVALIFGIKEVYENSRLILSAMEKDNRVIFGETGFICSVAPFVRSDIPFKYRRMHAIVFDRSCMYIDSRHTSDLERMLNSNMELSAEQLNRAKRLIELLINNKISKYNHQPIKNISIGKNKRKVLVVDQVYGDASISLGMATDSTFTDMLEAVVKENPGSDIIIKTHPDTNNTLKHRHFSEIDTNNFYVIDYDLNPYSLFEIVDSVYVCSSQLGFEALLAGKDVHVFGMPFYAGWGLTIDELHCARRSRKRTLEEVVYIFYIMYTRYVSYITNGPCEVEQVIDEIIDMREEYWREYGLSGIN